MSKLVQHVQDANVQTDTEASIEAGIDLFLDSFVRLRGGDLVLVLYTPECREWAARLTLATDRRGIRARPVAMRPLVDADFGERLEQALPAAGDEVERLVVVTLERDTMSHVLELRRRLARLDPSRVAVLRAINVCAAFFSRAMRVAPEELSATNAALLRRLMPADSVHVSSAAGTDLEIRLDAERFRWLSNRGVWRENAFLVFPAGEVSTYSDDINGVLVADGAFNVTAYTSMDARLGHAPVTLEIERSRVVDVRTEDRRLAELLERCLRYENADRIGEVGIGTNRGIDSFIPMNSHINERHPGLHLGLGQHGQKRTVVDYLCEVHLDLITTHTLFDPHDGRPPLDSGSFEPVEGPHPSDVDDEDIDGDCCGLFQFD